MAIDYNTFIHPQDKVALETLKKIPLFDTLLKAYMKMLDEREMHGINMASKIRQSPKQLPKIYRTLPEVCSILDIDEPEFYLEMDPNPNAYTFGDTSPFVVITSGLLDLLQPDELKTVVAHECGHILCHHVLYHSVGTTLLNAGTALSGLSSTVTAPIYWAQMYWMRRSELSCDRVAAYVMGDCDCVIRTMMRLSAGAPHISNEIDIGEYLLQVKEYADSMDESKFNKLLQAWAIRDQEHPFPGVRSLEVKKWFEEKRSSLPSRLQIR